MQIDLKALEQALAPIAEIGQGEMSFDVGGTPITIRVLRPDEERAIQRYAGGALNATEGDPVQATEYLDRFRIASLSHAIIGVGTTRFPDFVPTGETLDNGTPIQIERHKALRPMIEKWSRTVMTGCFKKLGELLAKVEKQAEKSIVYEPSDTAAEIERLEDRLKALKKEQETSDQSLREGFSKQVETLASAEEQQEAAFAEEIASRQAPLPPPAEPPPVQAAPAPARQPIVPRAAPPPVQAPVRRQAVPEPDPDSSFVNPEDDDEMRRAVEAENARLMDARRRQATGQPVPDDGSVLMAGRRPGGAMPPHADARRVDAELGVLEQGRRIAAEQARKVGEIDGVETFAMPTQALDTREPGLEPGNRAPVNAPAPAGGTTNPRFRPPQRQP